MSFEYTIKTGSLKQYLNKIKSRELGVPDTVNIPYLKSIDYTSSNDFKIAPVLKSIEFIDSNNKPTEKFKDFRTEKSAFVMASALKKTYAELFKVHPEAHKKTNAELESFFASKKPQAQKKSLGYYIGTFKALCEFADFQSGENVGEETSDESREKTPKGGQAPINRLPQGLAVNMNIQITLPVTDDAKVYENIFKAIREQLFKKD